MIGAQAPIILLIGCSRHRGWPPLRGEHVTDVPNRLVRQRGAPKYLLADNAYIETFNGSLRDECLNLHRFGPIAEARRLIEAWRRDYNERPPHSAHW